MDREDRGPDQDLPGVGQVLQGWVGVADPDTVKESSLEAKQVRGVQVDCGAGTG